MKVNKIMKVIKIMKVKVVLFGIRIHSIQSQQIYSIFVKFLYLLNMKES